MGPDKHFSNLLTVGPRDGATDGIAPTVSTWTMTSL